MTILNTNALFELYKQKTMEERETSGKRGIFIEKTLSVLGGNQ